REILRLAWRPLLAAFLTVLPWGLLIHAHEPDFWRYFIVVQHLGRFLAASSAQHPKPSWFLLPFAVGGGLPWTCLLPAAAIGWRARGLDSLGRLSVCWLLAPIALFSA